MLYELLSVENLFLILIVLVAYLSALFISMPAHEFAHAHAAYKEGDSTAKTLKRYTLAPFSHIDVGGLIFLLVFGIGYAKPVPVDKRNFKRGKKSEMRVAFAGILTNLGIGIVSCILYALLQTVWPALFESYGYLSLLYVMFFEFMISLNFMLALFNLLPIYPLDGFRVVEAFSKTQNSYITFMRRNSMWITIVLLITGILPLFISYFSNAISSFLLSIFGKLFSLVF